MLKINSELMLGLTRDMPMKQIDINDTPYLQRYYAGRFRDGKDLWLHRFLSNDGDRHLHCHPYYFTTIMLCGGYTEEYLDAEGQKQWRVTLPNPSSDLPGLIGDFISNLKTKTGNLLTSSANFIHVGAGGRDIGVFDWHRIASVEPETWTAMVVDRDRLPFWFFKDDDDNMEIMKSSPRNWHTQFGARKDEI